MINHARTLLVNQPGSFSPGVDYPGEEYVPLTYRPVRLTSAMQRVHAMLFGSAPDRAGLNLRARQLLTAIHSSELASYITDLDPRITYWPSMQNNIAERPLRPTVSQLVGTSQLFVIGNPPVDTGENRLLLEWLIAYNGAGSVTIERLTTPIGAAMASATFTDGLSQELPLTGSMLLFRFTEAATSGSIWKVSAVATPLHDIGTLVERSKAIGDAAAIDIFGTSTEGVYATFRNIWSKHPYAAYRLSGLVLGFIYRADERLKAGLTA